MVLPFACEQYPSTSITVSRPPHTDSGLSEVQGRVQVGAWVLTVGRTLTVKLFVPVLPAASLVVQVTAVVPSAKSEPEAGAHTGPLVTPTLSVAVAAG